MISALEGMMGHQAVTSRRAYSYQTEVCLTGEFQNIYVRGRADGYEPDLNQLEEIKTYKGHLNRMPDNHSQLHWAQAKIYGYLLCGERNLANIKVAIIYYITLGLPQINQVNEQLCLRIEEIFGLDYEYTYLWPALQKVIQAAGRIIRTTKDKGNIYLMDDRYSDSKIMNLPPKWWSFHTR